MSISKFTAEKLYKVVDKFNSKNTGITFELRIIADEVTLYLNKKERFKDTVKFIQDNEDIRKKYDLYFEAFEEGLTMRSLKKTLTEL